MMQRNRGKQQNGKDYISLQEMGTIKDRNDMDLTEADDIKKRWQEYIEELYKKRS